MTKGQCQRGVSNLSFCSSRSSGFHARTHNPLVAGTSPAGELALRIVATTYPCAMQKRLALEGEGVETGRDQAPTLSGMGMGVSASIASPGPGASGCAVRQHVDELLGIKRLSPRRLQ